MREQTSKFITVQPCIVIFNKKYRSTAQAATAVAKFVTEQVMRRLYAAGVVDRLYGEQPDHMACRRDPVLRAVAVARYNKIDDMRKRIYIRARRRLLPHIAKILG